MRTTAFVIVLSMALLSTVALAGQDDLATPNNPMSRSSKADVPGLISYQGTLTDSDGVALNTIVTMTFTIYTDSTGGSAVWIEIHPLVEVSDGLFNVLLGRVNAIPDTVFQDPERWLGVRVESDPELEPRQRMAAVGYAFRAAEADTADFARAPAPSDGDWTISGNHMFSAVPGSVGIGITDPVAKLHVLGGNIAVSDAGDQTGIKIAESWISDPYDGALHIQSGGDVVAFDGSDAVGIGTPTPSAKLDVDGDINADPFYKIKGNTVLSVPDTHNVFVGIGAGANNTANFGTFLGYDAGYNNQGFAGTFVGAQAGYSNQGFCNTFIGTAAGSHNTSGGENTFLGYSAGVDNTTGEWNTFIGSDAGLHNITGVGNTYVGREAGAYDNAGIDNTYLGAFAGYNSSSDSNNVFIGYAAGFLGAGCHNVFIGSFAGEWNTTGYGNVFIGNKAGNHETGSNKLYIANGSDTSDVLIYGDFSTGKVGIGTLSPGSMLDVSGDINADSLYKIGGNTVLSASSPMNTLVGVGAGANNTGDYGTFVGYNAGNNNQGSGNTFLGEGAGLFNTTGDNNTFLGKGAGAYNDTGSANTFVGRDAGYHNRVHGNTFLGNEAGYSNTSGDNNTFVGEEAGYSNTTGMWNTFIGANAGQHNEAQYNAFVGALAGSSNTSGAQNTFMGSFAGMSNTSGGQNTFLGHDAGEYNSTGKWNTFIGFAAGNGNGTGSCNTYVGMDAGASADGDSNVFIGHEAGWYETGSNKLYIANGYDTSCVLIYGDFSTGRVGLGTLSPGYKLDVDGDINTTGDVRQNGSAYLHPDYVFEPDYELMPLAELEDFVAANKQLPGMPSAEEVEKEGVKLFEQNRLLVEKLEEAYLYIIELQNRVSKLETEVESKLNAGL
jgi:hypothetical protein